MSATFATVRKIALGLPGVEEGTSYGTPAFQVKKKFLLRLKEDGKTIALKIAFEDRDVLMQADPRTFFVTDHYRDYPAVLVSLPRVKAGQLRAVIEQGWRFVAPARLRAAQPPRSRR